MCRRAFVVTVALMTFLFAGNSWAVDPQICDPNEDPAECQCTTNDWDGCQQVKYSGLLDPDNPAAVREATRLTAEWDPEIDAYRVTLDVRNIRAGAVLPLLDNRGEWQSLGEYDTYMGELLGIEIPGPEPGQEEYSLPPMRIEQKGMVVRFDPQAGDFIRSESGSLIDSIALNKDGELRIAGNTIWSINGNVVPKCPGRDDTAAANGGTRQPSDTASNGFDAYQCSVVNREELPLENCLPFEPGGECQNIEMRWWTAITSIEALPTSTAIPQYSCEANEFFPPKCSPVVDDFVVVVRTLEIESADIDNTYFRSSSYTPDFDDTPPRESAPFVESDQGPDAIQGGSSYGPRGLCGTGESTRNATTIVTRTRDGSYVWGHPSCSF